MKKIHLINSPEAEPGDTELMLNFLRNALDDARDIAISSCRLDQIAYVISGQAVSVHDTVADSDLAGYDLVWFRGKLAAHVTEAATIANYLQGKGVKTINSFYAKRRGVGKINQMYLLAANHFPLPATVSAASDKLPMYIERFLRYPVVVKDIYGSHGLQNYLVANPEELNKVLPANPDIRFMAQTYIESHGDYRILFAGDSRLVIHRLGGDHTHLNNTSQGAQSSLMAEGDFAEHIVEEARRFADLCDYEIAGVDVIIDSRSGQHYFLEINSQPQVANGAFVPDKQKLLGDYFTQLLNG